jgi:hypothetical protein
MQLAIPKMECRMDVSSPIAVVKKGSGTRENLRAEFANDKFPEWTTCVRKFPQRE